MPEDSGIQQPPGQRCGPKVVRVQARGEEFSIVQLQGNLFVCARQNGSCCCGWVEKGRLPFEPDAVWGQEWVRRKIRNRLHLTFTGCLGPCAGGNNALLQLLGRSIWLKDLNEPALVPTVFDYAAAILGAGRVLAPPQGLPEHVYERYKADETADGLERIDPVCLMEVDPTTARHTVDYLGRTIAFCAPSCKQQFLADPESYLVG